MVSTRTVCSRLPDKFTATLVLRLTNRHATVIGALAIIIGAAAGPFAQQLVRFDERRFTDVAQTGWLSRIDTFTAVGPNNGFTPSSLTTIFQDALANQRRGFHPL